MENSAAEYKILRGPWVQRAAGRRVPTRNLAVASDEGCNRVIIRLSNFPIVSRFEIEHVRVGHADSNFLSTTRTHL